MWSHCFPSGWESLLMRKGGRCWEWVDQVWLYSGVISGLHFFLLGVKFPSFHISNYVFLYIFSLVWGCSQYLLLLLLLLLLVIFLLVSPFFQLPHYDTQGKWRQVLLILSQYFFFLYKRTFSPWCQVACVGNSNLYKSIPTNYTLPHVRRQAKK